MNSKKLLLPQHDCLRQLRSVTLARAFPLSSSSPRHRNVNFQTQRRVRNPTTVTSPNHVPNVNTRCQLSHPRNPCQPRHRLNLFAPEPHPARGSKSRLRLASPMQLVAFIHRLSVDTALIHRFPADSVHFSTGLLWKLPRVSRSSRHARRSADCQSSRPRVVCLLRPRSTFTKTGRTREWDEVTPM